MNIRTKSHLLITIVIMVFIFIQSALPGDLSSAESSFVVGLIIRLFHTDIDSTVFFVRKAAHFTEYMLLGCSLLINMRDMSENMRDMNEKMHSVPVSGFIPCIYAWIIGVIYAATDEFHQRFVPDRSCEFRDVCIDAAGVAIGVLICKLITYLASKLKKTHSKQ